MGFGITRNTRQARPSTWVRSQIRYVSSDARGSTSGRNPGAASDSGRVWAEQLGSACIEAPDPELPSVGLFLDFQLYDLGVAVGPDPQGLRDLHGVRLRGYDEQRRFGGIEHAHDFFQILFRQVCGLRLYGVSLRRIGVAQARDRAVHRLAGLDAGDRIGPMVPQPGVYFPLRILDEHGVGFDLVLGRVTHALHSALGSGCVMPDREDQLDRRLGLGL